MQVAPASGLALLTPPLLQRPFASALAPASCSAGTPAASVSVLLFPAPPFATSLSSGLLPPVATGRLDAFPPQLSAVHRVACLWVLGPAGLPPACPVLAPRTGASVDPPPVAPASLAACSAAPPQAFSVHCYRYSVLHCLPVLPTCCLLAARSPSSGPRLLSAVRQILSFASPVSPHALSVPVLVCSVPLPVSSSGPPLSSPSSPLSAPSVPSSPGPTPSPPPSLASLQPPSISPHHRPSSPAHRPSSAGPKSGPAVPQSLFSAAPVRPAASLRPPASSVDLPVSVAALPPPASPRSCPPSSLHPPA
mmetsp:Transcript_13651/g.24598  ORF Transcript_13651/g.24598 Transcript_13651/m.24598 type:complete len:307 (-) Transcript_13651:158-1078(-)